MSTTAPSRAAWRRRRGRRADRPSELRRVLVPGGQLLLLEHVLSQRPPLRPLRRLFNPLAVRMTGANADRETVENVRRAGFAELRAEELWLDVVKLIEARAPLAENVD